MRRELTDMKRTNMKLLIVQEGCFRYFNYHSLSTTLLQGSRDSPYCEGNLELEIQISPMYPIAPPKIRWNTHPNAPSAGDRRISGRGIIDCSVDCTALDSCHHVNY